MPVQKRWSKKLKRKWKKKAANLPRFGLRYWRKRKTQPYACERLIPFRWRATRLYGGIWRYFNKPSRRFRLKLNSL